MFRDLRQSKINLETVLISFDKFVKHDLNECNLYHGFRSFSKELVIDGQPSEIFQPKERSTIQRLGRT